MNATENPPDDDETKTLLSTLDRDAPPPDRAFLAALRERSTAAFQAGTATTHPRKRTMNLSSLRWVAAVAALLVVGVVFANWIVRINRAPAPEPTPEDKFALSDKLTDDGRIGKVTDAQGVVGVKPVLAERWSPAQPQLVLKPGDWLRTDSRGANAVALKLLPATTVIVGPHSTVELVKANELTLLAGELEIHPAAGETVELHGPDKQLMKIAGRQFVRIEKDKLVRIDKDPLWLQGFKGTSTAESLGSLIATVDGRNVPLTVGYHHVTVDIRDQIARTVVEESFVNRTDAVLEGVFHFPLPADASISGFGMWIGDKLVEADVVEKQRAREIYETILREKRDPGLLEWAGGNIFKARVYPIPARSEKRIKISYTQVLPMKGNKYRYSYALQSELLKQHPLRDLKIDVKIHSATALANVTSPTHDTRLAKTEHSGHVEFAAQEYTPTRDFEAVVELGARPADVVVIPHQRGGDGYFLVQLAPPGGTGAWERPLIPNGDPLKLLLLADTSASMDRGQRATQNALIASLLGALTPKDSINVAACDVNCDWIFEKPVPATAENIASIRDSLAKRVSLGWTNLDKAFASAIAKCEPGTHAIYLGDGISTHGDADAVAFSKRLAKLNEGKPGTFHAIALGSSYEPTAMKTIASLGAGSLRRVSGEQGAQTIVAELLTEIATPALRNLKVEITGVRTARVYPEELPNVAAGSQQILLGRYLPEGKDQQGEIVVSGTLAGKPVRYVSKFSLKDAEAGNSFIPRLWARMHLDKLLEQGTSSKIRQDIIALSEEFNIITPYTSLLVLESDADRERFAVKRLFKMRDGETFFATGRESAAFELKQKQMRLAGDYRTALRRDVLARLQTMGRDAQRFDILECHNEPAGTSSLPDGPKGRLGEFREKGFAAWQLGLRSDLPLGYIDDWDNAIPGVPPAPNGLEEFYLKAINEPKSESLSDSTPWRRHWSEDGPSPVSDDDPHGGFTRDKLPGLAARDGYYSNVNGVPFIINETESLDAVEKHLYFHASQRGGLNWLGLFPQLPPPATAWKDPKSTWPAPALALSKGLLRRDKLAQHKGGLAINRTSESFNVGSLAYSTNRVELVTPTAWLTRSIPSTGPVTVQWCDAKELGEINTAYQLGRVRASNSFDLQRPPLELYDDSLAGIHIAYANYTPTVEVIAKDRALLILIHHNDRQYEVRYIIDTARNVVLSRETRHKGKVQSITKFDDFVEVAGSWWARKIETLDAEGKRTALTTQTIVEQPAGEIAGQIAKELAAKDRVIFLKQPLPKLAEAKAAVAANKATFDDRVLLTLHFASTQQWARAAEHLADCQRLATGKPGMGWLALGYLQASRQHEEWRKRMMNAAGAIAPGGDAAAKANAYFLANALFNQAQQLLATNEQLARWDSLEKVFQDQPAHLHAVKGWRSRRVSLLHHSGQAEVALALSKSLAIEYPSDAGLQQKYAQYLVIAGEFDAAYAWLDGSLKRKWNRDDDNPLRSQYAEMLQSQGRQREWADFLAKWIESNPHLDWPYSQYLTALVRCNRAVKAEELVADWLRDGRVKGELPRPTAARFNAAVAFALGQGYDFNTNRLDERWLPALAETVLFFAIGEDSNDIVDKILQSRFSQTETGRTVFKTLAKELLADLGSRSAERMARHVNWIRDQGVLKVGDWKAIATELRKRWDAEKDAHSRHRLGQTLISILERTSEDGVTAFRRVQWNAATDEYRREYAQYLFDALLSQPWEAELEDELFFMLDKLAQPDEPANGLVSRLAALHRVTDAMVEARYQAELKKVEHPEKLPRTDLAKKQAELRKLAREGLSERLRAEATKQAKPFALWLGIERIWLEIQLERDLPAIATECWAILDTAAPKSADDDSTRIDGALRERAYLTLMNLAARKEAAPGLIERVVKYVDQQIAAEADESKWKSEKYRLFIALDRSKELEPELQKWIAATDPENRWRVALGYLLAEQGKLAEAIKLFEAVEAADELTPAAFRSLADWYLVENRREQSEKATAALYGTTDEYSLHRQLTQYPRTSKLDPAVLSIFKILFEKSEYPQNYLSSLQQYYEPSRDFRLLSILPDGVVGHSAGAVYSFLQSLAGVLGELRDEATADELVARIAKVRETRKTPIDLRALDLLEVLVERRAAELQNQPGPHLAKSLVALQRGFLREWSPDEPKLMADFLAGLGHIGPVELAKEQLRQLEALHRLAKPGTIDRLRIAHQLANVLNAAGQTQPALDTLEAALKEYETAHAGKLPSAANDALGQFIGVAESAKQFERGEKNLLEQLQHPVHTQQRAWLDQRLDRLYLQALIHGGDVSLGRGPVLYKAIEKKHFTDLATTDVNRRFAIVGQLVHVYRTAHGLKIGSAAADLKAFASERLPALLKDYGANYDGVIGEVAGAIRDLSGPLDGIAFLLDRTESEPAWMNYQNQTSWGLYSGRLGDWRLEAKDLGAQKPRFLKFVLAELRRELLSRHGERRGIYTRNDGHYWAESAAEFAKVAEEILVERRASSGTVEYIANYFFYGLAMEKRAIEVLFAAHADNRLAESGESQLVDLLHRTNRHAESIPLLQDLVERRPETLSYRTGLMRAYFKTEKPAELMALLKATDAFFHEKDRWHEGILATLARSTLDNHLFAESVAYFEVLLPQYQKAHPGRGVGDGTLHQYLLGAADACAGLGKTKDAVDRASAAVVVWPAGHTQRKATLEHLVRILVGAPKLDEFIAGLDAEKLQSAVVRKAIGQALIRKKEHARAIPQLRLASELQPNDVETYELLVACFDAIGDKEGAVQQLYDAVELSRRELKLFADLGRRLADLKRPAEAERANTSTVEMQPNESESHTALAEIREKQNRWPEAISHWERVAEFRKLEPTGLLKLAAAQLHEKDWAKAGDNLRKLRAQKWPEHFKDVEKQTSELEKLLNAGMKD